MAESAITHYDEEYFAYQRVSGAFGGKAEPFKFRPYIKKTDYVIDFGCGGGFILKSIDCAAKIGVEVNPTARMMATENGIETVETITALPDAWANVIISNHCLEHVEHPLQTVADLLPKLKPGGLAIFVVPHEVRSVYDPNDINQHLYTWSPVNLGHLFARAGYEIVKVDHLKYLWPPGYMKLYSLLGESLFHVVCRVYGTLRPFFYKNSFHQTMVVARRKN